MRRGEVDCSSAAPEVLRETEKARLVLFRNPAGGDEEHWVPKSQCRVDGQKFYLSHWFFYKLFPTGDHDGGAEFDGLERDWGDL